MNGKKDDLYHTGEDFLIAYAFPNVEKNHDPKKKS